MNRYYTETIPVLLAEKLEEKGINIPSIAKYIIGNQVRHYDRDYDGDMPIIGTREYHDGDLIKFGRIDEECNPICCNAPSYAEVFDWLMEKDIFIKLDITDKDDGTLGYVAEVIFIWNSSSFLGVYSTWHGAADAVINKALELI